MQEHVERIDVGNVEATLYYGGSPTPNHQVSLSGTEVSVGECERSIHVSTDLRRNRIDVSAVEDVHVLELSIEPVKHGTPRANLAKRRTDQGSNPQFGVAGAIDADCFQ
jgi:hypothetical protein